jgi:hypothetical protein
MNPALQAIVNDLAAAIKTDSDKDAQIAQLQAITANPVLTLIALQSSPWELLWGVGRSKPINNPPVHGTATMIPGEPAIIDYHPAVIDGDSDNLYCLRRLAPYVNLTRLQQATRFSLSYQLSINDLSAVQAIESDFQRQLGFKVWNMGYQLLPSGGGSWVVRAFNYTEKRWVTTGVSFNPDLITGGRTVGITSTYTLSSTSETHESIRFGDGPTQPVGFSQPVFTSKTMATAFNVACQLDSRSTAKPYTVKLGQVEVTLA